MLQRVRTKLETAVTVGLEAMAFVSGAGATAIAVAFGKVLLAIAFGAFAFGAFLRLSSRGRAARSHVEQAPSWLAPAVAAVSLIQSAAMVEAVNLPVRMDQPGFQYYHWLLVLAFLVSAYVAQSWLFGWLSTRARAQRAP